MFDNKTYPSQTKLAPVTEEELQELKAVMTDVRVQSQYVVTQRITNENNRYCRWVGQSDDGRKHANALGEDAYPFEGSSDSRDFLIDEIVQEHVELDVAAATRGVLMATPVEFDSAASAGKVSTYLAWLVRNQWGRDFRRQVELLSQYRNADTPGLAFAMVEWQAECTLQMQELSTEDIAAAAQELGMPPEEAADLVMNPLRDEDLAGLLEQVYSIKAAVAKKAVRNFRKEQEEPPDDNDADDVPKLRFQVKYEKPGIPKFWALRAYEDIFYPENAIHDLNSVPVFIRTWLTKAQAIARAEEDDWKPGFLDELLGQEAKSAFDNLVNQTATAINQNWPTTLPHRGQFEVIDVLYPATDDDGYTGIYTTTLSYFVDFAATDRKLYDRKHGTNGIVAFPRENLTRRINDTRGIAELAVTQQNMRKLMNDSYCDHVQVSVNPPVKRPRGRAFFRTQIAPFGEIEEGRPGEIGYMNPPEYPKSADKFISEGRRQTNEYWGRFDPELNPDQVRANLRRQHGVDTFLASLSDVFALCYQLAQQFETDEHIARIVGGNGMQLAKSVDEIQGKFDCQMIFDVNDLEPDKALQKAETVLAKLSPFDKDGSIPSRQIIMHAVAQIYPALADQMPDEETANARVDADEKRNVIMCLNGTEPPMPEKLDSPQQRLQVFQQEMGTRLQNPNAFAPITPAARIIAQNRLKYLDQQATQIQNATIGRVGAAPVDLNSELAQQQPSAQPGQPAPTATGEGAPQ